MSYLDESGLSVYDSNLKEWISSQESKTITSSIYPWTKTVKAGIVSCYPVGGTKLKPVVDFLFTETPPVSGDKGPDNPSTIRGVNRINLVRANSNLLPYPYWLSSGFTANGITYIINEDGSVSATGTAESSSYFPFLNSNSPSTEGLYLTTDTYKYFGCPEGGSWNNWGITCIYGSTNTPEITNYDYGSGGVIKLIKPGKVSFAIRIAQGVTVSNLTFYPRVQIVEAPFEKNEQDAYNIDLGGTFYGGTLDVASGVMTVTHEAVVLTGQETWYSQQMVADNYLRCNTGISFWSTGLSGSYCTHYAIGYGPNKIYANISTGNKQVFIGTTGTLAELKIFLADQYAAGTPVVFVSKVPESEYQTIQLTPTEILSLTQSDKYTPRLNTVYTDVSAVQVGYVKSPIREEFELQQAIVSQGGEI